MIKKTMNEELNKPFKKSDWCQRGRVAGEQEKQFKKIDETFKERFENNIQKDKNLIEEYAVGFHLKHVLNEVLSWYKTVEGEKVFSALDTTKKINNLGIIEVDMKKIVATNKDLNRYIEEIINRMIDMMKTESDSTDSIEYIYCS